MTKTLYHQDNDCVENVKIEQLKESNIEHKKVFVERILVQMLNVVINMQSSGLCLDMV